jgi:hypothetical protein
VKVESLPTYREDRSPRAGCGASDRSRRPRHARSERSGGKRALRRCRSMCHDLPAAAT